MKKKKTKLKAGTSSADLDSVLTEAYNDTHFGKGAYFLFYSLQQFQSYLANFHEHIQDNAIKETLDIFKIQGDFADQDDQDLNAGVIISGSLGILGAFSAANPVAAGIMGVLSGVASVAANSAQPPPPNEDDGGAEMADRVQTVFNDMSTYIDDVHKAVFGFDGHNVSVIPDELKKQDWKDPSIAALGEGQWLTADATTGMNEAFNVMYDRMVSPVLPFIS